MKDSLRAGIEHELRFRVPPSKTVPMLYLEAAEFQKMPKVFATGFLIGLIEWTCIQAINPHIDWPNEQSVGIHVNLSHEAATPPGMEVIIRAKLISVVGRKLVFEIEANDDVDVISRGTHERFIIDPARFSQKANQKAEIREPKLQLKR